MLTMILAAVVSMPSQCDTADFNRDGVVDGDDVIDFITCYYNDQPDNPCYPCYEARWVAHPFYNDRADEWDWAEFFSAYEFCTTH